MARNIGTGNLPIFGIERVLKVLLFGNVNWGLLWSESHVEKRLISIFIRESLLAVSSRGGHFRNLIWRLWSDEASCHLIIRLDRNSFYRLLHDLNIALLVDTSSWAILFHNWLLISKRPQAIWWLGPVAMRTSTVASCRGQWHVGS
jgi:hypothetical protein